MAKGKQKSNTLPYQTTKEGDRLTPIFWQMMEGKAWGELSGNDIKIYLYMAKKVTTVYSMHQVVSTNKDDITVPRKEYRGEDLTQKWIIKLGVGTFNDGVDNLINLGFVKVNGYKFLRGNKRVIIYGMNEMWVHYGTSKFHIKEDWKRKSNRE